ncbi:MAG: hypothetical protein HDR72_03910 [Ruminococcaceae bacterium]|nr:hypothetical protein [Oscillospiraceae bacterium]
MDCALWLNRRKIYSADEIAGDPDIASLRGYFLAGSLVEWLRGHGGERYAKKLSKLRPDDPELNEKLAKIFGGSAEGKRFGEGVPVPPDSVSVYGSISSAAIGMRLSSYGSYSLTTGSVGSGRWISLSGGSFRFGSYFFGSGMHEWEWEWLFNLYKTGSFSFGSFTSFYEWEWEWLFEMFRSGSFTASFGFGSFWRFGYPGSFGSLYMPFTNDISLLDEYDRIMLETLMRCPLDRFGYGIHNI